MAIRSTENIYKVLEESLKGAKEPKTCADLMQDQTVRETAIQRFGSDIRLATNKLSDTLGFMWRRGLLQRFPSTDPTSMARFSYLLRETTEAEVKPIKPPARPSDKPIFRVTEGDNSVTFDFEGFTLIVKKK